MAFSSAICTKDKGMNSRTATAAVGVAEGLMAYPVPFNNSLTLRYKEINPGSKVGVIMIAVDGKQVDLSSYIISKADGSLALNLEGVALAAGLYAVQLKIDDQTPVFMRIIKQQQ